MRIVMYISNNGWGLKDDIILIPLIAHQNYRWNRNSMILIERFCVSAVIGAHHYLNNWKRITVPGVFEEI